MTALGLDTKPARLEFSDALKEWKSTGGKARYTPPSRPEDLHTIHFTGWPRVDSEIAYLFDRDSFYMRGAEVTHSYGVAKTQMTGYKSIEQIPVPNKWKVTIDHTDGMKSIEEAEWREISLDSIAFSKEQFRLSYYGLPEPGSFATKKSIWPWVVGSILVACAVGGWWYRRTRK